MACLIIALNTKFDLILGPRISCLLTEVKSWTDNKQSLKILSQQFEEKRNIQVLERFKNFILTDLIHINTVLFFKAMFVKKLSESFFCSWPFTTSQNL